MKATAAVLTCLILTACGQGDHDPAVTTAPVDAVTSNPAAQSTQAPPASTSQAYQQDQSDNVADRVDTDPLAACAGLDTTQRSDCELRARQGLDPASQDASQDIAASPATPPTDRATPEEALPLPADSTAETATDDDDR